ncbi:putative glycosyl hydrolase protein [Zalerion maritima]|uniref:Glycosyl hydrolase protein n=1 Tax=Zalerion maritima TaxID=339359 RepID=A0AAD5RI03_9PEZI|nr:putative glycosyl hydrolase protein [Zalerion maritima]
MATPRGFSTRMVQLLAGAGIASAACSTTLLVDDFSSFSSNANSLGSWTSDDGSMTSISGSGSELTFVPGSGYFYETFSCTAADDEGYGGIRFDLSGPSGASTIVEIQTMSSCSASSYTSYYYQVTGITSSSSTITIPFSSWSGANSNAVTAIVWQDFSDTSGTYVLDNVAFSCAGSTAEESSSTATPTATETETETGEPTSTPTSTGDCEMLLIDDWMSQSRLTFLYYNAMLEPSSDDATMSSLTVEDNTLTMVPADTSSYFYSIFDCIQAEGIYDGISLRINAPAGSSFDVQITTVDSCSSGTESYHYVTVDTLGWTFDGTSQLYAIDFSVFSGMTANNLQSVLFTNLDSTVTLGPMAFYCAGGSVTEYIAEPITVTEPTATEPAPSGTATATVIDTFADEDANDLGFWHGYDEGMSVTYGSNQITIVADSADYSYYTQLSGSCKDMSGWTDSYLHVSYSGSNAFTIALQQHNSACDESIAPFPETWDSLEAKRYGSDSDIYIPVDHFNINMNRVVGFSFKGFYTTDATVISKVEIVKSVPSGWSVPTKLPSGNLIFSCSRANSFAFAIDDGVPELAQEVMEIIREEDIKVTFFTVGAPLLDEGTNLSTVYSAMLEDGHQVALHSYTHPPMEGLPTEGDIDWEYTMDIQATEATLSAAGFDEHATHYFRPPFGTEGARMRQRFCAVTGDDDAYIVNWSVDVEDWLWAETDTPEKQLEAFQRDVDKGGNLVVLHYLYPSTVSYLRQFIQIAKATGKDLMRVDQCMEDPNAPAL